MALARDLGMELEDTGEVKDKKAKKEVNIETMNNKFAAVKTIEKNYFDGPINTSVCWCKIRQQV